jgi:tRNA-binding protein
MDRLERVSNETSDVRRSNAALGGGRMSHEDPAGAGEIRPFKPPGSASWQDFEKLDLRVGRIIRVEPFPEARKPAYRMVLDMGAGGTKHSSAQLPPTYADPDALVGRLVIAVVNFAPRRIAGFSSEVLVLGALPADGRIPLLGVDEGAAPGDPIG